MYLQQEVGSSRQSIVLPECYTRPDPLIVLTRTTTASDLQGSSPKARPSRVMPSPEQRLFFRAGQGQFFLLELEATPETIAKVQKWKSGFDHKQTLMSSLPCLKAAFKRCISRNYATAATRILPQPGDKGPSFGLCLENQ